MLLVSVAFIATAHGQTNTASARGQQGTHSEVAVEADRLSKEVVRLYGAGKYDEALPLAERALSLLESSVGPNHIEVANALCNLAELQVAKRRFSKAEPLYTRAIAIYEKAPGADDAQLAYALARYLCTLIREGRKKEALAVQKHIYRIDNKFDYDEADVIAGKDLAASGLMAGKRIISPRPDYPGEALSVRVSGPVVMKVTIDETGKAIAVETLCGHRLLVKSAEQAVRDARFAPTLAAGKQVSVKGVIIYNFVIQ